MHLASFEITSRIIELVSGISEKIGELNSLPNSPSNIQLRRENRIKTIHSSLSIENNSLSLEQISAIIDGKRVLGNPNEIVEVTNAIEAYDLLLSLNPYEEKDLLRAHELMMKNLVERNGKYRIGGVAIYDGEKIVHLAPPADMVPNLMSDLFKWLKESDVHPLIKSCVFHYEFEFIHPFQDGNGRIGRLWQTVILKEWKKIFAWVPIETLIKKNQKEYYGALRTSDSIANSTRFIEFLLSLILDTLNETIKNEKGTVKVIVKVTANQKKIIAAIKDNPYITQEELASIVGINKKNIALNMKKLQECGKLERIGADKNGYWQVEE